MASANLRKYTSEEILNKAFNFGGYAVANVDIPEAGLQPYEVVTTGAREIHIIDNGDLAAALTIAFKQEDGTYGPDIVLPNANFPLYGIKCPVMESGLKAQKVNHSQFYGLSNGQDNKETQTG